MSDTLYLTRARLRHDAEFASIAPLLLPDDEDARIAASHRLAWSLFAGDPARKRDFLWREEEPGRLLVLSSEPPEADRRLFDTETRPFAVMPQRGERFVFALRANPTVSAPQADATAGRRPRGKPVDVIMNALRAIPGRRAPDGAMRTPLRPGEGRAYARDAMLGWLGEDMPDADPRRPALDWLARQGARKGFEIDRPATRAAAYRRVSLPRRGSAPAVFGQVDFEGLLTVTDETAFAVGLREGFGRAKAFGCGLMLLARAAPRAAS